MQDQENYTVHQDDIEYTRTAYVKPVLDYCEALRQAKSYGANDFQLKAVIPSIVIDHYCLVHQVPYKEFVSNPEHIKRICNSPELSLFRVKPGRL